MKFGQYSIIQVLPHPEKGEVVNVGICLYDRDEGHADLRVHAQRARALDRTLDVSFYDTYLSQLKQQLRQTSLNDHWLPTHHWLGDFAKDGSLGLRFTEPGGVEIEVSFENTLDDLYDRLVDKRLKAPRQTAGMRPYRTRLNRLIEGSPNLVNRVETDFSFYGPLKREIRIDAVVGNQALLKLESLDIIDIDEAQRRIMNLRLEIEMAQDELSIAKSASIIGLKLSRSVPRLEDVRGFLAPCGSVRILQRPSDIDTVVKTDLEAIPA